MYRSVLMPAVLMLGLSAAVTPAAAADGRPLICGLRAEIAASLAAKFSERPVSVGLNVDGGMLEVFASKSGTFTVLLTDPTGHACVMTAGNNWESMPAPKESSVKGQRS